MKLEFITKEEAESIRRRMPKSKVMEEYEGYLKQLPQGQVGKIVMDKKDKEVISMLYDAVMDILLETGRLISLKIFASHEFNRLKAIPTPFMKNVMKEGVRLGLHD